MFQRDRLLALAFALLCSAAISDDPLQARMRGARKAWRRF